jgi:hypothetical protein
MPSSALAAFIAPVALDRAARSSPIGLSSSPSVARSLWVDFFVDIGETQPISFVALAEFKKRALPDRQDDNPALKHGNTFSFCSDVFSFCDSARDRSALSADETTPLILGSYRVTFCRQ